jgi:tetratricopeptide (TPR) repeat protein
MKKYQLINNVLGWVTFLIAAFVYCSTIEPTASFWDCPEFITTGYKLEVGHAPGAPFFMLTANLFSQLTSDPSQVARIVNTMSALLSATTILFLFWSITHLTRKLILKDWTELTTAKTIAIMASGIVGALIYTFSDTFWFSAVEGEVYAYSSAFTAIVFWLILKWEDHADEPHSDRWLVLIMYMIGLSIGVHLLNLLCIPAIVLVYCYRRFPNIELKGSLIALLISFILVAAVLYGVVPGIITVGGWFELFFVNTLGMPFNTGEIIYIILLVASVCWAIYETYNDKNVTLQNVSFLVAFGMLGIPFYGYGWKAAITGAIVLTILWFILNYKRKKDKKLIPLISARIKNTILMCMLMLMVGYSTYAVIVIRSLSNPPMDQNSPEDIFTLGSYISRDQYGDRPLFYGPAYTSQVKFDVRGDVCVPNKTELAPIWQRKEKASKDEKDSYFIVNRKVRYNYAQNMLFPRMYDSAHAGDYESWMGGVKGTNVPYDRCGETVMVKVPSQIDNIRFFLSYQCNFMYWRYFMWNFAGRQNDRQGNGELEHGNWITGIPFIDNARLGDQSKLPQDLKNNKGHNVYYCLPLLLGLIGLFWQAYRGRRGIRQFWVVFFLFFMTGLAIVIYLNQTPSQPRERDYAYAGSFYAFAIWCGMGVAAIIDLLKKGFKKFFGKVNINETVLAAICSVACVLVPIQMASQNWDDHDRSGRFTCRDFGQNYLMTLPDKGNPIIFTNGDNDTFPLWYNQDVEGFRTDARVCNLSYLQTDWYIDQMKRPAFDSPSLPINWKRIDYCAGTNDMIEVRPEFKQQILEYYKENPEEAREQFGDDPFDLTNIMKYWVLNPENKDMRVIPTDTVYVKIDKEAVKKSGMMMASDTIPDKMVISLEGKRILYKGDLMMLELINNSNWTRPIYVAMTVGSENYMNLGDNFIQEGLANRISPFTTKYGAKSFDTEKTYNNMMNRYRYGGMSTPGVYIDETVMRMCYTHRRLFAQLALSLISEGKNDKALKVLQKSMKELPDYNIPLDYLSGGNDMAKAYALLGNTAKAKEIINKIWTNAFEYATWYLSLDGNKFTLSQNEVLKHLFIMKEIVGVTEMVDKGLAKQQTTTLNLLMNLYQSKGGHLE